MNKIMMGLFLLISTILVVNHSFAEDSPTQAPCDNQVRPGFVPVDTLGVPKLNCVRDGEVKVFKLVAEEVRTRFCKAADCLPLRVWGYNGSMPGPVIEVFEGDTIRVEFENHLPEPTTVHWHGIELPFEMDGAPFPHLMDPVPPGGKYTYEFTLIQHGTYFYHPHVMSSKQVGLGLTGLLIVHPKIETRIVDKEYAMLLQIWKIPYGKSVPDTLEMADFNWFTINGKVAPDIPHLNVLSGEKVRVRVVNLSMLTHPIHLHGHTFTVVEEGSGWIPQSAMWQANTVDISAGESRSFEFTATQEDGPWVLHCHFLHHVMNDMDKPPLPTDPMGHESHGGMGGMHTVVDVFNPDSDDDSDE